MGAYLGEKRLLIQRYEDEINDFRDWDSDEASHRIAGNVRRINQLRKIPSNLGNVYLVDAYLPGADLRSAYIGKSNLQGTYLHNAQLQRAYLGTTQLQDATLSYADLSDADLNGANTTLSVPAP
jgi:uncharacterized protein YjbI with pentapeptide repeats